MRLSNVVFPHPEGPWTATSSPSATCISRPRSAITSDFPVRYTLIRSLVRMFGTSATSKLEDPRDVHARDANRDRERREEHRGGRAYEDEQRLRRGHVEDPDPPLPSPTPARRHVGGPKRRPDARDATADPAAHP